jgi:hypothetical protein
MWLAPLLYIGRSRFQIYARRPSWTPFLKLIGPSKQIWKSELNYTTAISI